MANRLIEPSGASAWTEHAAAADAWERQHAAEWARVDQKLRGIAARRAALDAEEANLLRYAEELKLWLGWGFGSMLEYMERVMGYAPRTATERLRVARALTELPLIAEALERGELAHSAVRELSRVAVPDTEDAWLEAARGKSLREIEALVSGHRPGHLPTDETEPRLHRKTLTIEVSPETYDLWRKLHALAAEEHGQRLSDDELIASVFRRAYGEGGGAAANKAGTPAYKIAIKQCPDCKRAWQYSGGRDIEVDPAVAECAACDAVHLGSLDAAAPERATTTVTARKREQALARDGYCCTVPGCRRNVGLDLHHIEYQSHGGGHELKNLTTICDLHHRAIHFGKLLIRGTAPDRITFEFRKPRDRRNVTDDEPPICPAPRSPSEVALPSPARGASPSARHRQPTWAPDPPPPPHGHVDRPALGAADEPDSPHPHEPGGPHPLALHHQPTWAPAPPPPPHGHVDRPALGAADEPGCPHPHEPGDPHPLAPRDEPTWAPDLPPHPHGHVHRSALDVVDQAGSSSTSAPHRQPTWAPDPPPHPHGHVDRPALGAADEPDSPHPHEPGCQHPHEPGCQHPHEPGGPHPLAPRDGPTWAPDSPPHPHGHVHRSALDVVDQAGSSSTSAPHRQPTWAPDPPPPPHDPVNCPAPDAAADPGSPSTSAPHRPPTWTQEPRP